MYGLQKEGLESMSNKVREKLDPVDQVIRRLLPERMTNGTETLLTIEYICGFELFNTRRYHNYESWSTGYRVTCEDIVVEAEDLDDAIRKFEEKYIERSENEGSNK